MDLLVRIARPKDALELARQAGAGHVMLLVGRDNQAAQVFYRSLGFSDDDTAMCIWLR
jgi:ribosomal protein S18 acetylase RimI-like enzyme